MSEIEEIKTKYPNSCACGDKLYSVLNCPIHGLQVYKDIQILLSSLETKEREREQFSKELILERMKVVGLEKEIDKLKGEVMLWKEKVTGDPWKKKFAG